MSVKIDFDSIFEGGDIISNLKKLEAAFFELDKVIDEIANKKKVELFGGVKTMQANEDAIAELTKAIEKKNKLEEVSAQLQKDIAKFEKEKLKAEQKIKKAEDDRIKRNEQIQKDLAENLTLEEKNIQTLELRREQLKDLKKEFGATSKEVIQYKQETAKLTKEIKENNKITELNNIINDEKTGHVERLAAKQKLLRIQTNKLTSEELENSEAAKKMVEDLADVNQELIDFGKGVNDGRANVGRYAESLQELSSGLGGVSEELSGISGVLTKVGGLLSKQAENWKEVNKETDKSKKNTKKAAIGIKGIGAIAGGVGAAGLTAFFAKSASGFEKFRLWTARAKGYMNTLIASFSSIGAEIVARFSNIGTKISNFFAENKLKVSKFALEAKKGIQEALSFEIKGIKFGVDEKTIDNTTKELSKVDAELAKIRKENADAEAEVNKTAGSFAKFFKMGGNIADTFEEIERIKIANEKLTRSIAVTTSEIDKQAKLLQDVGEDDTINFERRREASKRAAAAFTEAATMRLKIQNNQIKALQLEANALEGLGLKDAAIQDQLTEAIVARNQLEQEYTETLRDNSEFRKKAISDEQEVALDAIVAKHALEQDAIKTQLADEKISYDQRRQLLVDLEALNKDFYTNQLKTITENSQAAAKIDLERNKKEIELLESKKNLSDVEQRQLDWLLDTKKELTKIASQEIDLSEILSTTDAARTAELIKGLKLGEKWQIRSLEIMNERVTATRDLKEESKTLNDSYIADAENQYALDLKKIELLRDQKSINGELLVSNEELNTRAIEAEKTLLQAQLDRYNAFEAQSLTETQIVEMQRLEIAIESLNTKTKDLGSGLKAPKTAFDLFFDGLTKNFEGTDDELAQMKDQMAGALGTIQDQLFSFLNEINAARQENLESELSAIEEEIAAREKALEVEQQREEEGKANNVEIIQAELRELEMAEQGKREELEATQERQAQFAAAQQALNGVLAASNMVLAATEVFKSNAGIPFVGVALATGAVLTMLATFAGVKRQLQGFHDGTEYVEGKSGRDNAGVFRLEKGERVLTAEQNKSIPRNITNKAVPELISIGLASLEGKDGVNSLNITTQEKEVVKQDLNNQILSQIFSVLSNSEEVVSLGNGKYLRIEKNKGKVTKISKN